MNYMQRKLDKEYDQNKVNSYKQQASNLLIKNVAK